MCSAYVRIAKICPPHIWRPESLIYLLSLPEPCFPLIDCLQVALSILGLDRVERKMTNYRNLDLLISSDKSVGNARCGEKRTILDAEPCKAKRQKVDEEIMIFDARNQTDQKHICVVASERAEDYANYMHASLLSFIEFLKSPAVGQGSLRPGIALTALSMLCITFCRHPEINLALRIFQEMYSWIPWIVTEVLGFKL